MDSGSAAIILNIAGVLCVCGCSRRTMRLALVVLRGACLAGAPHTRPSTHTHTHTLRQTLVVTISPIRAELKKGILRSSVKSGSSEIGL